MGDEYISVEHLFLSMLRKASPEIKKLFKEFNIDRERFLQALSQVRGNQKVTTDNPEAVYESLSKYGTDLVEQALEICRMRIIRFTKEQVAIWKWEE